MATEREVPDLKPDPVFDGAPPTDESGDVDISVVEYCLRMTPAQRLDQLEELARFVLTTRRANRIKAVE